MKRHSLLLICFLILLLPAIAVAQTGPSAPPKVLSIFREDIKPGRGAAHEKLEAGYVRALEKANHPTYSLAITAMAGASDAWFITGYDSFEAYEKDRQAIEKNTALIAEFGRLDERDAEFRTSQRAIVAVHRDELSYRPTTDLPTMRFFEIITVRARPGHDGQLIEAAKLIRAASEKANRDGHYAVYQVVAGLPSGTFLVFVPMKSLKEIDTALDPKNQAALNAAMGADNGKKLEQLIGDAVVISETTIYSFNPMMSYVSKEFAARDASFWNSKEVIAARRPPRKLAAAKVAPKEPEAKNP
jgi:hypothetical protein